MSRLKWNIYSCLCYSLLLSLSISISLDQKREDTEIFENIMKNTYKYTKECMRTVMKYDLDVPSIDEISKHHQVMLEITKPFRGIQPHVGNDYHGPWIENYFITHFLNKSITSFGGFVPLFVQWIDYHLVHRLQRGEMGMFVGSRHNATPYNMFRPIYSKLRRDMAYIMVSQSNDGNAIILNQFPNVLVLSAGGNGNLYTVHIICYYYDYIYSP